jgi:hypothetical protein
MLTRAAVSLTWAWADDDTIGKLVLSNAGTLVWPHTVLAIVRLALQRIL